VLVPAADRRRFRGCCDGRLRESSTAASVPETPRTPRICSGPLPVGVSPVAVARPSASVVAVNVRAPLNVARPSGYRKPHDGAGHRLIVAIAHFDDRCDRGFLLNDVDRTFPFEHDDRQRRGRAPSAGPDP
jgi:hypothetical protein